MTRKYFIFGSVLILALLVSGVVLAAVEAGYDLSWWTVDGGGGSSSGGNYSLSGTIGQPDAASSAGGGYTLAGGFWNGGQGSGNYTCVASYNGSYAALNGSCQP